jgi:hypothetical protein
MLRINLLPPYIYAGKSKRNVTIVWVVILVAVIGGLLFFKSTIDAERDAFDKKAQELEPTAAKADADQLKATQVNTDSATIRAKRDFAANAVKHDQEVYPNLYRNVVMYTWNRVLYDNIRPEGTTVSMSAYTPSLNDVAHYIMAMERNPNISRVDIRMNDIPGFPGGGAQQGAGQQQAAGIRPASGGGHDFQVTLNLYQPIPAGPAFGGGGGGQQQGGGMPGMGGMGGGMMPGGMMSGGGGPPGGMGGPSMSAGRMGGGAASAQ